LAESGNSAGHYRAGSGLTGKKFMRDPDPAKVFFDTNILIYAFSAGDRRQNVALDLLMTGGTIGVQTLNEFASVMRGKVRMAWPELMNALQAIESLCLPAIPLTLAVHRRGIRIAYEHRYPIYDSLMLAAALEGSCTVFYSEDLQGDQNINSLTIRNPFG
jgi:predicted nucleic acid-binding protein